MPPRLQHRKRKNTILYPHEVEEYERQMGFSRAKSRRSLESGNEPQGGMEVTPTSSHATAPPPRRGVKRKASEERAAPTRYSPPPIETGVSDETLNSFALAIGRGPLVAPLMWRGIEDAAKLWAGVEEYVLFARQRGDRAPFFPATRVVKYIAHKALKQYKEAGKVDLRALKEAEQDIKRFQDALGLTWDPVQERATALVIAGAQLSWGADEAHVDGASDTGGIS